MTGAGAHDEQSLRWTDRKAIAALVFGLLAAPFAFLLDLSGRFALVEFSCRHGSLALWIVLIVALALALAGALRAWLNWQHLNRQGRPHEDAAGHPYHWEQEESDMERPPQSIGHTLSDRLRTDEGGPHGRSRFMALAGIALSGFFIAVILASLLPSLLLSPCT